MEQDDRGRGKQLEFFHDRHLLQVRSLVSRQPNGVRNPGMAILAFSGFGRQ
jgi:hypothetical protein